MSDALNGWLGILIGLLVGTALGGIIVYIIVTREAKTTVKNFAYDETGRLIQVMEQKGV